MLLASCYGHLGRAEDARITWAELLKVNPDFSLTQRARVLPYKDPADFQRIAEGFGQSRVAVAAFFDELGRASSQCRSDRPSAAAADEGIGNLSAQQLLSSSMSVIRNILS